MDALGTKEELPPTAEPESLLLNGKKEETVFQDLLRGRDLYLRYFYLNLTA